MDENELSAMERRMNAYPLEARNDVAQLISELRRLRQIPAAKAVPHAAAHLYDAETGLLNAGAYGVRFAMARARATRYRKIFAVMLIDFEPPALEGRAGGRSTALRQIAGRLEGCLRATDTLARVGDENFAIIIEDLSQPDQAERVRQLVREALGALGGDAEGGGEAVDIRLQFYPGLQVPAGQRLAS